MKKNILIVDDEADIRALVKGLLEDEGYETCEAGSADQAFARINSDAPSLIILDIWLQGSDLDGLGILERVKAEHPAIPVLMISGHGTIETAVAAIKQGAYDFIEKPFKSDRLLLMVRRALETADLIRENTALKEKVEAPVTLLGASPFIKTLRETLKRVAPSHSRVLLTGAAGTGKTIVARYLHQTSDRADGPFMTLNCATLQPERLEAVLFGVAGAGEQRGVLEAANGGTLFLDEIVDMPIEAQGRFMAFLRDERFQRAGSDRVYEVDVRIVASSNRDLKAAIAAGRLREDLYYRLNVVPIAMVPLSERVQDIEALAGHFLGELGKSIGVEPKTLSSAALRKMGKYDWPGNIRQLHNVLEWMMIMYGHTDITAFAPEHLPAEFHADHQGGQNVSAFSGVSVDAAQGDTMLELPLREAREAFERSYLFAQVERFEGNISKTAQFIGMERSALHRKLKSLQDTDGAADDAVTPLHTKRA
ncbi:MAG: sigma-54-dependent transcriptional regulator [Bdellovibrionales bacterium]